MAASITNLTGKTVCLTGTLSGMTRAVATKRLSDMGAIVVGSMSSRVHLLIAGDKAGSKLDYANRMSIPVWDEAKFQAAIEEQRSGAEIDAILRGFGDPVVQPKVTPEHYGDF